MNDMQLVAMFVALFAMAITWLVLVTLLFRRLESAHPAKYEAMGKPSFANSPAAVSAVLRLVATREHKTLGDDYLSRLCDSMLVLFLVYIVLFFTLFLSILNQAPIRSG